MAKEEDPNKRMAICKACPHFSKTTSMCKKCGCAMRTKVRMKGSKCPLLKW